MLKLGSLQAMAIATVTAMVTYVVLPTVPGEVLFQVVAWGSVATFFTGVRRNGALGWAWVLIGGGYALFALGDLLFTLNEHVWDITSFPTSADAAYVAGYPLLAAGFATLVRRSRPGGDRIALIDAAIIVVPAVVVTWIWLVEPYASGPELGALGKVVSAGYPLGDLLCLAVMVRLLTSGRAGINAHMPALAMLVCGFLVQLAADVWYMLGLVHGTYVTGGWNDALYVAPYIALAWTGAAPSIRFVDEPRSPQDVVLGWGRLTLLAVAALVTPGVLFVQWANGSRLEIPLVITATGLSFLLVVTRMSALVRALEAASARHAYEATHDMLTGLPNRVAVFRHLSQMLTRHAPGALLFVDLDRFKQVNDRHGHFAGDDVLVAVANRLRACARPNDLVGRLAGDEFVLLLETSDATAAYIVAERVVRSLNLDVESDFAEVVTITASVGVVTWRSGEQSWSAEGLLAEGDRAMYRAKTEQGNQLAIGSEPRPRRFEGPMRAGTLSSRLRVTGDPGCPDTASDAIEEPAPSQLDALSTMARFKRRRAERHPAGWLGRCRFASSDEWMDCRVIDISILGAAVEIATFAPVGSGPMVVEVHPLAGERTAVRLPGEIRNRRVGDAGRITVGLEFSPPLDELALERVGALLARPAVLSGVRVHD